MENHYETFIDLVNENIVVSGDYCVNKLIQLADRVGIKRHKTLNRLISAVTKFGCCIEFVSHLDVNSENFEEFANFYSKENTGTQGCFRESDCWISVNLDLLKSWKDLEEVFAHETVHLLQSIVFQGERSREESGMELAYPRIFSSCDEEEYVDRVNECSDEDFPIYEVEAYSIQDRPKQVAFAAEWLLEDREEVWAKNWYCPV
jgi:hypothetical protein